ncbi:hypothetical protein THRCLA_04278 [Thraustotheca clavata]|uniref:EGF-like domain-containing protein n=1 Tax=Thraustotheca clavata TaxID=74557 RepID=A0A1V9ZZQ0_9STRA|nr:hypothetical protein THRCLA_04278 [Thraustotheca clavata]
MYLRYNGLSDTLNRLACACGVHAATNCFSQSTSSNASLTGQTTVFCGNDTTSIPTGSGTAVVSMTCPSSSRRRLDTSSPSSQISFSQYSIASYNQMYEPYCASNAQNPLAIISTSGVIYGQLLGPGQGIMSSSSFNNISICLSIDSNIRQWPAFDTLDVAVLQSNSLVPTNTASFSVANGAQLCFTVTQNGVYFPIRRASGATSSTTCSLSCNSKGGSCVYDATTQQSECLCNCGYSGSLCETGCLNSCSGQGTCYKGTCYCNTGYAGADCSNFNCPADSNNRPCFNNGVCTSTGCVCNSNYQGTACDTPSFALLNGSAPQDFVSTYVASTTTMTLPPDSSTPSPTTASAGSGTTSAPTTTEVKTPTPTKGSSISTTPMLLLQLLLALVHLL